MKPDNNAGTEIDEQHKEKRFMLRVVGVFLLIAGGLFMLVGFVDFARAMGSFDHQPRLFWCLMLGMPLLWLGFVLSSAGFAGSAARYMAGESAPVAKDTAKYMA